MHTLLEAKWDKSFIGRDDFSLTSHPYVILLSPAIATSFLLVLPKTTSLFTANSSVDSRT